MREAIPYLLSFLVLFLALLLFFGLARGRYRSFGIGQFILRVVVAMPLLVSAVVLHWVRRNEGTAMIPPVVPSPIFFVLFTGVLEIAGAVGLFVERTRRSAALWIAILLIAVFPANVFVAGQTFGGMTMPSVPVRLLMQVVYLWMVLLAGYGVPGFGGGTDTKGKQGG